MFHAVDGCAADLVTIEITAGEYFVIGLPEQFEACKSVAVKIVDLPNRRLIFQDEAYLGKALLRSTFWNSCADLCIAFSTGQDFLHYLGTIQGDLQPTLNYLAEDASVGATALQVGVLSILCTIALAIVAFGMLLICTRAKTSPGGEHPSRHEKEVRFSRRHEVQSGREPRSEKGGARHPSLRRPVSNPYMGSDSRESADVAGLKRTMSFSSLLFSEQHQVHGARSSK
jgi:hypothetical protein